MKYMTTGRGPMKLLSTNRQVSVASLADIVAMLVLTS